MDSCCWRDVCLGGGTSGENILFSTLANVSHSPSSFLRHRLSCFKDFVYLFLERGEGRGRQGGKHWCMRETLIGCLLHTPSQGPSSKPRYVPWPGIKWQLLGLWDKTQPPGSHQLGLKTSSFDFPNTIFLVFPWLNMNDLLLTALFSNFWRMEYLSTLKPSLFFHFLSFRLACPTTYLNLYLGITFSPCPSSLKSALNLVFPISVNGSHLLRSEADSGRCHSWLFPLPLYLFMEPQRSWEEQSWRNHATYYQTIL